MSIYRKFGPLVGHEEFVIDVTIISLFVAVEDESRKQFVVSDRWNVMGINHL
jgi:hypothetical protein